MLENDWFWSSRHVGFKYSGLFIISITVAAIIFYGKGVMQPRLSPVITLTKIQTISFWTSTYTGTMSRNDSHYLKCKILWQIHYRPNIPPEDLRDTCVWITNNSQYYLILHTELTELLLIYDAEFDITICEMSVLLQTVAWLTPSQNFGKMGAAHFFQID